jgi:hypothetical protein
MEKKIAFFEMSENIGRLKFIREELEKVIKSTNFLKTKEKIKRINEHY